MQPISGPQDAQQRVTVREGNTLRILTRDGRRRTLKVMHIDATGLDGRRERIDYRDMVFVERRESSVRNASGLAMEVVLVMIGSVMSVEVIGPGLSGL